MYKWIVLIFLIASALVVRDLTYKAGLPSKPYWRVELYVAPKQGPERYAPADPTLKGLY
jgi:hypothetical protein